MYNNFMTLDRLFFELSCKKHTQTKHTHTTHTHTEKHTHTPSHTQQHTHKLS